MIELGPQMVAIVMLAALVIAVMSGFPLALAVGSVGLFIGLLTRGMSSIDVIYMQLFGKIHSYTLLALPMFIYMGSILESSGLAEKMYRALFLFLGRLRGGLAASTIALGAVLATCVGVIGASVSMLTLIALPSMVNRGYSKSLAAGSVCAGGTLGILIPPSIMLVVLGPLTGISVGRLFGAAFLPGFLLAGMYILYVTIRCAVQPTAGPPALAEEIRATPFTARLSLLLTSFVPPAIVIFAVLGSIILGLASPTEAAAFGGFITTLMIIAYRKFSIASLKKAVNETMRLTGMVLLIAVLSVAYTSIFLLLGGGDAVAEIIVAAPGGRWGSFAAIMVLVLILGMFMDWMGIIFIIVPILLPAIDILGFDLLWAVMMVVVNLQAGFLSPPFATAIFYLRGAADPKLGVQTGDIIRGVYPFICVVVLVIVLCSIFPEIVLWLPRVTFGEM